MNATENLRATEAYVPELDGIRGVAIGIVVAAHYRLVPFVPGGFGVTLFFFVSGYLITSLFYAEFAERRTINIGQFYLRRWLRLTPPLLIFILLATLTHSFSRNFVGGDTVPAGTVLAALFYYTNYYDLFYQNQDAIIIPFGICWSLAIEEHFYIIWPAFLHRWIGHPTRMLVIVLSLCILALGCRFIARDILVLSPDYNYMATECRIDSILFGALLRVALETRWANTLIEVMRARATLMLALLALLVSFLIRNEEFRDTLRYTLQGVALMPCFVFVLSNRSTVVQRVLAAPAMVLIGRLSYSIYLFHLLARTPAEVYTGSPYGFVPVASGLVLTSVIALTIFYGVERPIGRVRQKLRARYIGALQDSVNQRVEVFKPGPGLNRPRPPEDVAT